MPHAWSIRGTTLEDFLAEDGSATADRLRHVGHALGVVGVVIAVGVLVALATFHRGPRRELSLMLRIAGGGGAALLAGGVIELVGVARAFDVAWSDAITQQFGAAPMLRLLAGVLVVLGLFDYTVPVGPQAAAAAANDAVRDPGVATPRDPAGRDTAGIDPAGGGATFRWLPSPPSAFGLVGAALALVSFGFDGHTVTEGPRLVHVAANLIHVAAGSIWVGGVFSLVTIAVLRRRSPHGRFSELVAGFSQIATVVLVAAVVSGAAMTLMINGGVSGLGDSVWGRRLVAKLLAVALAIGVGGFQHFVVVPRLRLGGDDPAAARQARTLLVIEALVFVFVIYATTQLVRGSIA